MATCSTGHNAVAVTNAQECHKDLIFPITILSGCKYVHSVDITGICTHTYMHVCNYVYLYLLGVENLMKSAVQ